jgi:hypothetical protein
LIGVIGSAYAVVASSSTAANRKPDRMARRASDDGTGVIPRPPSGCGKATVSTGKSLSEAHYSLTQPARLFDLKPSIRRVGELLCLAASSPIAAPSIIVIMPCAWMIFVEIFMQVSRRTMIITGLSPAIETLLMSTSVVLE